MLNSASQDTEITLGTGKMLGLFFALVIVCAVFFAMGFSWGRTSARPSLTDLLPDTPEGDVRPSAVKSGKTGASSKNVSFHKATEQKSEDADTPPESLKPAASTENKAPISDPIVTSPAYGYYVQVAAVSKQEDAEALVDALKKKQYSGLVASASADKLFHVQVGPFSDIKDAESARTKLVADGYNPILKK
ncbi:MAG: SPOR domain-containing protein [Acidobacteriota bacterium]|nr:SPOR domain-containing protein [Acidobacteriota bacterium]